MSIDLKKIKEEYEESQDEFETLPQGQYNCYVYDIQGRMSSNENPMLQITLKVADEEYRNRQLWTNVTLIPKAYWKVEEFLNAVNYDEDDLPNELDGPEDMARVLREDVIGSKVVANVEHREYQGETQESVESVEEPSEDFDVGEGDEDIPF